MHRLTVTCPKNYWQVNVFWRKTLLLSVPFQDLAFGSYCFEARQSFDVKGFLFYLSLLASYSMWKHLSSEDTLPGLGLFSLEEAVGRPENPPGVERGLTGKQERDLWQRHVVRGQGEWL